MIHSPVPRYAAPATIASFARTQRERLGIGPDFVPCLDLEPLLWRLGGMVRHKDFLTCDDTAAFLCGPEGFTIYVPDHTTPSADLFEEAQCLGYRLLHYPVVTAHHGADARMIVDRYPRPRHSGENPDSVRRVHREALIFAFEFLMPADVFSGLWAHCGADRRAVARRLGLTERHVAIRATALALPGAPAPEAYL